MTDDFTPLTSADHYLAWLGDDPAQAVRDELEAMLQKQVLSARVAWVHLEGEPQFLTGGRRLPEEPNKIIVTRAALAVAFELFVTSDTGDETLRGVFSWAATGLDGENRRDRTWLDINADFDETSQLLKGRIYEPDAEDESEAEEGGTEDDRVHGSDLNPPPPSPESHKPWWKRFL